MARGVGDAPSGQPGGLLDISPAYHAGYAILMRYRPGGGGGTTRRATPFPSGPTHAPLWPRSA